MEKSVNFCKGNITFDEYLSYLKSIDDVELHQKGYDPVRYGGISICNDIRGTEIAICGGPFIETYEYYNMSKSESELLLETIKARLGFIKIIISVRWLLGSILWVIHIMEQTKEIENDSKD